MTKLENHRKIARELLKKAEAKGLKTGEVVEHIYSETGNQVKTIKGNWWKIKRDEPDIIEIDYARYALAEFIDDEDELESHSTKQKDSSKNKSPEESYYEPFALFLENEEICTEAISTEGTKISRKWHNPDVIGVRELERIHSKTSIITAEIKSEDTNKSVMEGFGQSCAYKLFSHEVYLVVPTTTQIKDSLLALCIKHNIGLVFFDPSKKKSNYLKHKDWEIKNLPIAEEPNYAQLDFLIEKYYENNKKNSKNNKIIKLLKKI